MAALFRSEEVTLCPPYPQSESANNGESKLGEIGLIQFNDLNADVNALREKLVNEKRLCKDIKLKLESIEKEIKRDGIPELDIVDNPEAHPPRKMIELKATFEKLENELKEAMSELKGLRKTYLHLIEYGDVLENIHSFFERETELLRGFVKGGQVIARHGFVTGVIPCRMFPALQYNSWPRSAHLIRVDAPTMSEDQVLKTIFVVFLEGEVAKSRVKPIWKKFPVILYPCPETAEKRREIMSTVAAHIKEFKATLTTIKERHGILSNLLNHLSNQMNFM